MSRVRVRRPSPTDRATFLDAVRRSRRLHRSWVHPPDTATAFERYVLRDEDPRHEIRFICLRATGEIAGVVELSEIVRGCFCSAYMGYYAFVPYAGQGYMTEGLALMIDRAFGSLKLHRIEANIQPSNAASVALVRGLGFRMEGYSPRYLKIGGRWRDHERWAILSEDWRSPAPPVVTGDSRRPA